jgi:hypothetical protein
MNQKFINTLNKDIVEAHLENIKNKITNPYILFDDGEVVTEDNRGNYYTQIPPAFREWEETFLFFEVNGRKVANVILTMEQAYHFREKISLIKKGDFTLN